MTDQAGRVAGRPLLAHKPANRWRHVLAILAVVAYLSAGIGSLRALEQRWQVVRFAERGIAFGARSLPPAAGVDPWGVNVALEQHADEQDLGRSLDLLAAGGFHWVRQRFPWTQIEPVQGSYQWERWDAIVNACQGRGLRIIAVLDGSPGWARAPEEAGNPFAPPRDPADFAAFARALAARYGPAIDHYQIWDEPNAYPHWGKLEPDPAGYLALLRAGGGAIRAVDPGAVLVAAGLAPTTDTRDYNLNELLYLRGLYEAGGRDAFDVVAAKPYGFWSGPEDRQVSPEVLNFSRLIAVREVMVQNGDSRKPVWAVSWGWNALPEGWQGRPSPWGSDTPAKQHDRDLRAIRRAQEEWPWLGLMCYAAWQPGAPPDDPVWGLALLDRQGTPGPLYDRFRALAQGPQALFPGHHTLPAPADGSPVQIRFWGNALNLQVPGRWPLAELDGQPLGRAPSGVRGLPTGEHRLLLQAPGPGKSLQVVVTRERLPFLPLPLLAGGLGVALLATLALWRILRPYPWQRWFTVVHEAYRGLTPWAAFFLGAGVLALLAAAPNSVLSLLLLGILALLIAGRVEVGLLLAVFLIPLAPLQKRFGPLAFSYLEMVTLLTLAAWFFAEVRALARLCRTAPFRQALTQHLRAVVGRVDALDVGLALLVGAALLSLAVSAKLKLSLRELRVVVLQAAFLYWLISRSRLDRERVLRLSDALVLGATIVSLYGLYQYVFTNQVIVAEGVRRVRAIYGSPNNLALVLGRVFPIMLAMFLAGPRGRRRWAYGVAAALAALGLFLTFSKGAWLLGVPAALLVLGLLAGGRTRLVVVALAALGLVILVPLLGTARFSSLLFMQGTSFLRIKLWEAAWDMVRDHPWLGVGLDNFMYQYPKYIRPEAWQEPNLSHPHNWVLDFWLRLGLPGLLAFIWLQWHFFRAGLAAWRRRRDQALWALNIGLVAGMVDMLVHGLIDTSFFVVELAGLCALLVALVRRLAELDAGGEV